MISWIKNIIDDWKFEREFQKKKEELMKLDPFIYNIPSDTENHLEKDPNRYKTWENKGKDIDF